MSNPGKKIRIPLPEKEAISLLLKVKPTADMPRQGAHPAKAKLQPGKPKALKK
jgi:hypothetical protein